MMLTGEPLSAPLAAGGSCPHGTVNFSKQTPTVALLADQSGSTDEKFGGGTIPMLRAALAPRDPLLVNLRASAPITGKNVSAWCARRSATPSASAR